MRAPENIVENTSVRKMKKSIMAVIELVRVRARLSSMSGCFLHLPQVYLSHNERPYVGEMFEHQSDLMLGADGNTEHCHFQVLD